MAPLAAERSITISPHSPEHGMAVLADQQRLRQILVNLLSNAIKYNRLAGPSRSPANWREMIG